MVFQVIVEKFSSLMVTFAFRVCTKGNFKGLDKLQVSHSEEFFIQKLYIHTAEIWRSSRNISKNLVRLLFENN